MYEYTGMGTLNSLVADFEAKAKKIEDEIALGKNVEGYFRLKIDSPEFVRFMSWLALYDKDMASQISIAVLETDALTLSEIKQQTGKDLVVPKWLEGTTKVPQDLYVRCCAAMTRADRVMKQERLKYTDVPSEEADAFAEWWLQHDREGFCAFSVLAVEHGLIPALAAPPLPQGLFEFWKKTKGTEAPPKHLLGYPGINWTYVGLAASAAAIVFLLHRRKAKIGARRILYSKDGPPIGVATRVADGWFAESYRSATEEGVFAGPVLATLDEAYDWIRQHQRIDTTKGVVVAEEEEVE